MEDLTWPLPHCVSSSECMQSSLTAAAAAAEDGELLDLTSPCRVTSAERYRVSLISRVCNVNSLLNASLNREHERYLRLPVTTPGQFKTLSSIHYVKDCSELEVQQHT